MKKFLLLKLKMLTQRILAKYNPTVVGVTGSVGKTTTKEAIYTVLSSRFRVRKSIKNYNNEIGVPLSVIGAEAPGRSLWGWLKVFVKAWKLIIFKDKNFPEILVLEMGVDRPGDMDYLISMVRVDIGVITSIGASHLEYFKSLDKIAREKGALVRNLKRGGHAVLNFDDERVKGVADTLTSRVVTYGFKEGAAVKAQNLIFSFEDQEKIYDLAGVSFKMNYNGSVVPVKLSRVLGYPAIYSSLAAASVGIAMNMNLVDISSALNNFSLPPGRMNLIKGVKHTMIIDDTYNASPQSSFSAIEFIEKLPSGKNTKWAVFGDMLELGNYSEKGHREVGEALVRAGFDKIVTVGERALDIAHGAQAAGLKKDDLYHFSHTDEAGKFIQGRIEPGDLLFIKGSQGARMERVVRELMADPLNAKYLLVRQGEEWES